MDEHVLKGEYTSRKVWLDGLALDPRQGQKIHNHSPDGFNWGYEGSGPAQLALSIMLKLFGSYNHYQELKRQIISLLPQGKDFHIKLRIEKGEGNIRCTYLIKEGTLWPEKDTV